MLRTLVIALAILARLMNPTAVRADSGTTPPPSETSVETSTAEPTETAATESPTPEPTDLAPNKPGIDLIPTEALPKDPPDRTPTEAHPPRVEPVETATPAPPATTPDSPDKPAELVPSTPSPVEPTAPELSNRTRGTALGDALRGLPENTGVIVLDNVGKPLPLASQEAAQVIAASDPVWCPTGQIPIPGANGCTTSYLTLADLVANEGGNIAADGVIWISSGAIADMNPVAIDGLLYPNWSFGSLTIQGGWSGITGDIAIGSNSAFSVPITITNWNNGITVQNIDAPSINVLHVTSFQQDGVSITNVNSDVNLDHIQVHGAAGTGLYVNTTGFISASNISSSNCQCAPMPTPQAFGDGAYLESLAGVTLGGTNLFRGNEGIGLVVSSAGDITLNSITSLGNAGGININAGGEVVINDVTIDQSSGFGLGIVTDGGYVTINNSSFTNTIANETNPHYSWGDGADIFTNGGNITILDSHFTGNAFDGLYSVNATEITIGRSEFSGNAINGLNISGVSNLTIHQSQFRENRGNGLSAGNANDISIVDSVFDNPNATGAYIYNSGNITLSGGAFTNNNIGLSVSCVQSVNFTLKPLTIFSGNITRDIATDPVCPIDINPPRSETFLKIQGKLFTLDCAEVQNRYVVRLANGDQGEIFCPVDGEASIDRVDNTTLPASLPVGYTYASAFDVKILQNNERIDVIREGGYITASFLAQNPQSGNTYSILYWDEKNGIWIPLKELLLDKNGKAESFALYPGITGDDREIRIGVHLVTKNSETRVEVSTNFPGIFVLAQQ
jgi:hypothetical protein